MTKRKPKTDTIMSLALELARERMAAAEFASRMDEEASFGFIGNIHDYLPQALDFVIRCRKADDQ
jgi:hypothetical protein